MPLLGSAWRVSCQYDAEEEQIARGRAVDIVRTLPHFASGGPGTGRLNVRGQLYERVWFALGLLEMAVAARPSASTASHSPAALHFRPHTKPCGNPARFGGVAASRLHSPVFLGCCLLRPQKFGAIHSGFPARCQPPPGCEAAMPLLAGTVLPNVSCLCTRVSRFAPARQAP